MVTHNYCSTNSINKKFFSIYNFLRRGWMVLSKKLLTQTGYDALKKKLRHLKENGLKESIKKVYDSRNFCDFNEDPEYQRSIDELTTLKKRIGDLEYTIKKASVIKKSTRQVVQIGSIVTVRELTQNYTMKFQIVSSLELNLSENIISDKSPIGKSLIDHTINETVEVMTPSGMLNLLIIKLQ